MELWELIRLVSTRYGKRLEQHRNAHTRAREFAELTPQQFQYLLSIQRNDSSTIGFLSTHFGVRSPTATVIVSRLEERDFLKKLPDSQDRRSNRLVLTPKARRALAVQEAAFKSLGQDIKRALSSADLELYARLTEQVCITFGKES